MNTSSLSCLSEAQKSSIEGLKVSSFAAEALAQILESGKANTVKVTGSGRRTSYQVFTFEVRNLLDKLGMKCYVGNDAPRGGKAGEFVALGVNPMFNYSNI